jgi:hypothetical protein
MNSRTVSQLRREMNAETAKLEDARVLYPSASESELFRIAEGAQVIAELAEAKGIKEGTPFSAEQSVYGCDWAWGNGIVTRDEFGRVVIDEDAAPTARVFDCDGNTIAQLI